uniref:Uncharacterized protein n=1 Tax=Cannabis sativa TaxID=3483 RepID=A0A803QJF7_CANSA
MPRTRVPGRPLSWVLGSVRPLGHGTLVGHGQGSKRAASSFPSLDHGSDRWLIGEVTVVWVSYSPHTNGRDKETLRRAPPYDPHVAMVAIRGRIIVEEETAQPPVEAEQVIGLDHVLEQSPVPEILDSKPPKTRELGWPSPTPYEIGYFFELKSRPKQSRIGYFYFIHLGHQWSGDTNCKAMSKAPIPRGQVGEASICIGPRGPVSDRPTHPVPTARGKGKVVIVSSNSSFSDDDGMSSRMRGLVGGPLDESTGQVRAKVVRTSRGADASGPSLPPPPLGAST